MGQKCQYLCVEIGGLSTKASVIEQSADGLGESAASGRFAVVTVLKACMSRAEHVGTNAKSGDPGEDTVTDVAAARGVRSLTAGRSACKCLPPD